MPQILFHKNCADGTGAKFAAWTKFGSNASYTSVQYGDPVPDIQDGQDIYILDFSYPRDVLEQLRLRSKSILVLDHHKTAQEALTGLPYAQFDMNKSGAVLAWEHFHPGEQIPDLLLDIQDRDLWKWERENSKAVSAGLPLLKNDMFRWGNVAQDAWEYTGLVQTGSTKILFDEMAIESSLKSVFSFDLYFENTCYRCGTLNTTTLGSEIGNAICLKGHDIGLPYFITSDGQLVLSFRSTGDVDVSVMAKYLGGGGHKNAAGAKLDLAALGRIYSNPVLNLAQLKQHVINKNPA